MLSFTQYAGRRVAAALVSAMAARRLLTLVAAVALCAQLCAGSRKLQDDPTLYDASKMTKQQVKDALAYQQLFTGYAALNPVRPTLMEVNCAPRAKDSLLCGLAVLCVCFTQSWCRVSRQPAQSSWGCLPAQVGRCGLQYS